MYYHKLSLRASACTSHSGFEMIDRLWMLHYQYHAYAFEILNKKDIDQLES